MLLLDMQGPGLQLGGLAGVGEVVVQPLDHGLQVCHQVAGHLKAQILPDHRTQHLLLPAHSIGGALHQLKLRTLSWGVWVLP